MKSFKKIYGNLNFIILYTKSSLYREPEESSKQPGASSFKRYFDPERRFFES
jgi:hypothetical protein